MQNYSLQAYCYARIIRPGKPICHKAFRKLLLKLDSKIYICISLSGRMSSREVTLPGKRAVRRKSGMHEFSIAVNIVEIATEYAEKENAKVVKEIEIEVGELSGVVIDALEFCMEAAVKDSVLEGSEWSISPVKGKARCSKCKHEFDVHDFYTVCPECHTPGPEVIRGGELRVKSLLVE